MAEPNNPDIPWLTDKGRLFFDGMFEKSNSEQVDWDNFFYSVLEFLYFFDHLNYQKTNGVSLLIAFENVNVEVVSMLYLLEQSCSMIKLKKVENFSINNDFEFLYQIDSSTNKSKLSMSSLGILLNTNTRHEGYVLNISLRQRFLKGNFKLLSIGSMLDITLPTSHLGSNMKVFKSIGEGTDIYCQDIKNSSFPILIHNTELFKRNDSERLINILKYTGIVSHIWNGLNVLNHNISNVGVSSLKNFLPLLPEDFINFLGVYFINVSLESVPNMKKLIELQLLNIVFSNEKIKHRLFVNQNNFNDNKNIFTRMNFSSLLYYNYFFLPNNLFLEDNEIFINTEGLIKKVTKLINFKKDSKNNWQIIRKFYASSKKLAYFNNSKDNNLIYFDCMNILNYKNYINFQYIAANSLTSFSCYLNKKNKPIIKTTTSVINNSKMKIFNTKLKYWLDDFFIRNGKDSFSYNSSIMSKSSNIMRSNASNFF